MHTMAQHSAESARQTGMPMAQHSAESARQTGMPKTLDEALKEVVPLILDAINAYKDNA